MVLILNIVAILFLSGSLVDGAFSSIGFNPWDHSADLPSGYFTLLRIAVTAAGASSLWLLYKMRQQRSLTAIIYVFIAVLYQPFIRIELGYQAWLWIDLIVLAFMSFPVYRGIRFIQAFNRFASLQVNTSLSSSPKVIQAKANTSNANYAIDESKHHLGNDEAGPIEAQHSPADPWQDIPRSLRVASVVFVVGTLVLGLTVAIAMQLWSDADQLETAVPSLIAEEETPASSNMQDYSSKRFLDEKLSAQEIEKQNTKQKIYDVTTGEYHDLDIWCGFIQNENGDYSYINNCNKTEPNHDAQVDDTAEDPQPSFSCSEARTLIENAICSDKTLAVLDAELAAAYYRQKEN